MSILRKFGLALAGIFYRVRSRQAEPLPEGGALLVCNHVSYVDVVVLQMASPRPIRFLAFEGFFHQPVMGFIMRSFGAIPVSPTRGKEAIRRASEALKAGELVCIFAEGQLTKTGEIGELKQGFELIARLAKVPVVPVYLDLLWGSIFSFERGSYFLKWPKKLPYEASVTFGRAIPFESANVGKLRRMLLDLGYEAFCARRMLDESLGYALVKVLKRNPGRVCLVDRSGEKARSLTGIEFLTAALVLSSKWKKEIPGQRVGVALPPGIGGSLATIALTLAEKTVVHLNFTAGSNALASALRRAEISTVISDEKLEKNLAASGLPLSFIRFVEVLEKSRGEMKSAGWKIRILPVFVLRRWFGLNRTGGRREATILFTSGSSSEPKGVVLTHRNLTAVLTQLGETPLLRPNDVMLGCLPLFHSFGLSVTFWYPLLNGVKLVTLPTPLDAGGVAETCREEGISVLLGTPTFLRHYLKKLTRDHTKALRTVVAGAEKVPAALVQDYQEKLGMTVYEGYGLTETSPVLSINLEHPPQDAGDDSAQVGHRDGSVGRLLPGIAARLVDPESGEEGSLDKTGLLEVRGENVFSGYLGNAKATEEAFHDGWFRTGDLARFDEEGFLFIEGRLSRFSKIGGEMVSHGAVEAALAKVIAANPASGPAAVVVGVPDESKGEALVLLTTNEVDRTRLLEVFKEAGLPNLWVPKKIVKVEEIPLLGSGKVDLRKCKELALAEAQEVGKNP